MKRFLLCLLCLVLLAGCSPAAAEPTATPEPTEMPTTPLTPSPTEEPVEDLVLVPGSLSVYSLDLISGRNYSGQKTADGLLWEGMAAPAYFEVVRGETLTLRITNNDDEMLMASQDYTLFRREEDAWVSAMPEGMEFVDVGYLLNMKTVFEYSLNEHGTFPLWPGRYRLETGLSAFGEALELWELSVEFELEQDPNGEESVLPLPTSDPDTYGEWETLPGTTRLTLTAPDGTVTFDGESLSAPETEGVLLRVTVNTPASLDLWIFNRTEQSLQIPSEGALIDQDGERYLLGRKGSTEHRTVAPGQYIRQCVSLAKQDALHPGTYRVEKTVIKENGESVPLSAEFSFAEGTEELIPENRWEKDYPAVDALLMDPGTGMVWVWNNRNTPIQVQNDYALFRWKGDHWSEDLAGSTAEAQKTQTQIDAGELGTIRYPRPTQAITPGRYRLEGAFLTIPGEDVWQFSLECEIVFGHQSSW